jgi:hypothetical protein
MASPLPALVPTNPGLIGWAGMAFIGGGESNKLWIVDALNHKLVDSIDVAGPMVERTEPRRYPNLRDAHAIVFEVPVRRQRIRHQSFGHRHQGNAEDQRHLSSGDRAR